MITTCTRTKIWLEGYKLLLDVVDKIYKVAYDYEKNNDDALEFIAGMFSYNELVDINGVLFTAELPIEMLTDSLHRNHIMCAMAYRNEYYYLRDFEKANEWMKNHVDFKDIRELVFQITDALKTNDEKLIKLLCEEIKLN
jgi:hypothetical protein